MDFKSLFDSSDVSAEVQDSFFEDIDEDEKRKQIKSLLKDLISESKEIINETERKFFEGKKREKKLLENVPKLPPGIRIKINRQKPNQQKVAIQPRIQPTIKKSFPDPSKFKTTLPAGIRIIKLKKTTKPPEEMIKPTQESFVPPASTLLDNIPKLPPGIKIVKLSKPQVINLPKLPPGIKIVPVKKTPVLEEPEKMEESFIDDDFITYDSDFENESSPIDYKEQSLIDIVENNSPLVEIKCGVCCKIFNSLQLLENHSCEKADKNVKHLKDNSQILKLTEVKKSQFRRRIEPANTTFSNLKKDEAEEAPLKQTYNISKIQKERKKKPLKNKDRKRFFCPICDDLDFKTLKTYNNHILLEHKTVEHFPCKVCSKILLTENSHTSHMTLAHMNVILSVHQCEYCDKPPFIKGTSLDIHIKKCHPEVNHKFFRNTCEICGKVFSDLHKKVRHVEQVHQGDCPTLVCEICGKSFKTSNLTKHYRTHNEASFSCSQCDGVFRHRGDLNIHMRIHTGERPFECTICHERFIASSNLTKHRKSRHLVHTGIAV